METIKSYTDLEQSKKLAEILPLESADYFHAPDAGIVVTEPYKLNEDDETVITAYKGAIPCWSLAALLEHLRKHNLFPKIKDAGDYILMDITFYDEDEVVRKVISPVHFIRVEGKNILDACYELILKLHELKML